jgi:hypothetical protein
MATKTKAAPAAPDEADVARCQRLARDLLGCATPKRESAYAKTVPASDLWNLFQGILAGYDVELQAEDIADKAHEEALDTWRQTPIYQAVVILEEKIKGVQTALSEAQNAGIAAEASYQQALVSEDEAGALAARQQALDSKTKCDFQTERLGRLQVELVEARAACQTEQAVHLRQAAARLRSEYKVQHQEALAKLGAALESALPDALLADEVEYCIRRWI